MHHRSDAPQHRVVELVAAQDRLERAVPSVVGELDPAHVERGRVGRHAGGVLDEDELGVRVHLTLDQPRTRRPVDVDAGTGHPPHGRTARPSTS